MKEANIVFLDEFKSSHSMNSRRETVSFLGRESKRKKDRKSDGGKVGFCAYRSSFDEAQLQSRSGWKYMERMRDSDRDTERREIWREILGRNCRFRKKRGGGRMMTWPCVWILALTCIKETARGLTERPIFILFYYYSKKNMI